MTIKVLVVDDHGIVRQGLMMYLQFDDQIEVVGEAEDGQKAVEQARLLKPDVVLMDILMPNLDGVGATTIIKKEMPEVQVIILTGVVDEAVLIEAFQAGATGFLLKDTHSDTLCQTVKTVYEGEPCIPTGLQEKINAFRSNNIYSTTLTQREYSVLKYLAQGYSNKEISTEMYITEKTVKAHLSRIFTKLGVTSRTQAALFAHRMGIRKRI